MPTANIIRRRGLSEKIVHVYSPMPDVKEAELLEEAGLDLIGPSDLSPFSFSWRFSSGAETEWLTLNPGDFVPLRESEARDFMLQGKELGFVLVNDPNDPAEVAAAAVGGLTTAVRYWSDRGNRLAIEWRKRQGLTKEEAEEQKHDVWVYHLNEAKASVLRRALSAARLGLAAARRPAAPSTKKPTRTSEARA